MSYDFRSTRVALHCPDKLAGDAIAGWLDTLPGWLVVGSTVGAESMLRLCRLRTAHVALLHVDLSSACQLDLVVRLGKEHPGLHLISLSPASDPALVRRLHCAGVRQVVCVRGGLPSLRAALDQVRCGLPAESSPGALTDREIDVLTLVCGGLTTHRIADALALSPHTVGNHKRRIFAKLGVRNRTEAAAEVVRLGLVRTRDSAPVDRLVAEALMLTHREAEILASIARAESVRQTAQALGIAVKTVQSEQRTLFSKLGAHNRVQALSTARARGFVESEPR